MLGKKETNESFSQQKNLLLAVKWLMPSFRAGWPQRGPPNPLHMHRMTEYTHVPSQQGPSNCMSFSPFWEINVQRAPQLHVANTIIYRNFYTSAHSRYTGQHLSSTHLSPIHPSIPKGQNNCRSYGSSEATRDQGGVRAPPASPRVQTTQTLWARESKRP